MRRPSPPSASAGFTLIEIMIVLVIVGLLMTSAMVGFGAVRRGRLKAGAAHVASAFRFGYVHALTTGRATRVCFALGGDEMWVEDTDDAHVLDTPDPRRRGATAEAAEAAAQDDARLAVERRPRAPRAEFTMPHGPRFRHRRVENDVVVARLYTSHDGGPRESGIGYVYFFSGGNGEPAVVHLRGSDGTTYSVVLHPLTGRSEILDRPVEPPQVDDRDATDQVETDANDPARQPR